VSKLHFYRIIILSREILMNDSIESFFSHNLTVGLIFRDYFGPQEIPLIPGWIYARRAKVIRVRKHRLGERD